MQKAVFSLSTVPFILFCPPCFAGAASLPPVACNSYTGRRLAGLTVDSLRGAFLHDDLIGRIDAPAYLPAGAHCAPRITVNGQPVIERPHIIYPAEIAREAAPCCA